MKNKTVYVIYADCLDDGKHTRGVLGVFNDRVEAMVIAESQIKKRHSRDFKECFIPHIHNGGTFEKSWFWYDDRKIYVNVSVVECEIGKLGSDILDI